MVGEPCVQIPVGRVPLRVIEEGQVRAVGSAVLTNGVEYVFEPGFTSSGEVGIATLSFNPGYRCQTTDPLPVRDGGVVDGGGDDGAGKDGPPADGGAPDTGLVDVTADAPADAPPADAPAVIDAADAGAVGANGADAALADTASGDASAGD